METPADAKTLAEIELPDGWTWQDTSIRIQPGRITTATAVHQNGYQMEIEVTGKLIIFTEGTNSEYTIGLNGSASIHCNGVLNALQSVEMDGKTVDPSNYDQKEGSTIITFKKAYLDTLNVGTHTVTLVYESGRIETSLEIKKSGETTTQTKYTSGTSTGTTRTNTTETKSTTTGAKTGDHTNVAVMAALAVLSLGVCLLLLAKRKKQHKMK